MNVPPLHPKLEAASKEYLEQLRSGDPEAAFHNLIELDPAVVPILITAFEEEDSARLRADLLRVISEFRSPLAVTVFGSALDDRDPEVWHAALDGFVALASPAAAEMIARRIAVETRHPKPNEEFLKWLREALQQTADASRS